jgi:hypothetical protein
MEVVVTEVEVILAEAILEVLAAPTSPVVTSVAAGPMFTLVGPMFVSPEAAAPTITAGAGIGATPTPHAIRTRELIRTVTGRNDAVSASDASAISDEHSAI